MKRFIALLAFSLALFSSNFSTMAQEKKEKKEKKIETLTCWVSMDCDGCVAKIKKNIAYEKGVKDLNIDLKTKLVTVKYRKDKTSPEKLEKAIRDLGFKTEIIKEVKKEGKKVK
ncbi:MAG: heavy metal-associated domain-containing protein [Bacteroidota bacterium]|nr:heavy metal-associated domain-containing protein [Bacteroidota bacterium]